MPRPAPSNFDRNRAAVRDRIFRFATERLLGAIAEDLTQRSMLVRMQQPYWHKPVEELVKIGFQPVAFVRLEEIRKHFRRGDLHTVPLTKVNVPSPVQGPEISLDKEELARRIRGDHRRHAAPCRDVIPVWMAGESSEAIRRRLVMQTVEAVVQAVKRCEEKLRDALKGAHTW